MIICLMQGKDVKTQGSESTSEQERKWARVQKCKGERTTMKPRIIYQDNAIVVAYKPAGLTTQTAKVGQPDMLSELKKLLKVRYLGVVHRLDQPVEGLLVFALTQEAAAKLTKQLAGGTLNKQYYAAVSGKLSSRAVRVSVSFFFRVLPG